MKYDLEVAWQINDICDFDCFYCWLRVRDCTKKKMTAGINDTQKVIGAFNKTGLTWLIHMSGGEPLLFPNFIRLCEGLTKNHCISVNTNLNNDNIFQFAEIINPDKVDFLHCSIHIKERKGAEKIKDFIRKFKTLQRKEFHVFASYLVHPGLIDRFEKDYSNFKSEGIILHPKVFWGDYHPVFKILDKKFMKRIAEFTKIKLFLRKQYPGDYSKKQRKLILSYINRSIEEESSDFKKKHILRKRTIDLALDKNWLHKLPSFKGKYCLAGSKFVKMDQEGEVIKCNDGKDCYFGNLFKDEIKINNEPLVCKADICSCPYVGYRYALQ